MKFTKSKSKKKQQLEVMQSIFDKMVKEEDIQNDLRIKIEESMGDGDKLRYYLDKYDRSIYNWEQLNKQYATYDTYTTKKSLLNVPPETWIILLFGLGETLLILNYEQLGIITSKAFQRLPRKRV